MPLRERNPLVTDVRILNSENSTYYYFAAREDRLKEFFQFTVKDRRIQSGIWMPGISFAASLGIKAIFTSIPKVPAVDILTWLRDNQKTYLGEYPNPTIGVPEIEGALGRYAATVTQLFQDGSGDEIRTEPA